MSAHLLHIGYHKTATTWLQEEAFLRLADLHLTSRDRPIKRALSELMFDQNFDVESFKQRVKGRSAEIGKPLILSNEGLSGRVWEASYNQEMIRNRLAEALPTGKVLVVIRSQTSMLPSLYAQYVNSGGTCPYRFLMAGQSIPGWEFDPAHLEYDRLVAAYRSSFGTDRVLVLPYEWLGSDSEAFLRKIAAFAGSSLSADRGAGTRNPSLTTWGIAVLRCWNRLCRESRFNRPRLRLGGGSKVRRLAQTHPALRHGKTPVEAYRSQTLAYVERYRDSNRRLADLCGFDLTTLGYPT